MYTNKEDNTHIWKNRSKEVLVQFYVDQYRENAKRSTGKPVKLDTIFTGSIVKQNQLNMRDFQKMRLWHLTSCIRK